MEPLTWNFNIPLVQHVESFSSTYLKSCKPQFMLGARAPIVCTPLSAPASCVFRSFLTSVVPVDTETFDPKLHYIVARSEKNRGFGNSKWSESFHQTLAGTVFSYVSFFTFRFVILPLCLYHIAFGLRTGLQSLLYRALF